LENLKDKTDEKTIRKAINKAGGGLAIINIEV
jgi:hypothetical protein